MQSKYFIITDADDIYKNITFNTIDFVNNFSYADGADEQDGLEEPEPKYVFGPHNRTAPSFLITMPGKTEDHIDGFDIFESRGALPYVGGNSSPIQDGFYTRRITDTDLINCLDEHENLFFIITGAPKDYDVKGAYKVIHGRKVKLPFGSPDDSILRHFKIAYMKAGDFYEYGTDTLIDKSPVLCLFSAVKMGALPIYVMMVNTKFMGFHAFWNRFYLKNVDAICSRVMKSAFPLKQELFDCVIKSNPSKILGKYKVFTKENTFAFEMFGVNTNERFIKEFKDTSIPDFNDFLTVKSNMPVVMGDGGLVTVDISAMVPGEMAYVRANVDCGTFFNDYIFRVQRMYFEYVIIKE